jgi:hypothetical protein
MALMLELMMSANLEKMLGISFSPSEAAGLGLMVCPKALAFSLAGPISQFFGLVSDGPGFSPAGRRRLTPI